MIFLSFALSFLRSLKLSQHHHKSFVSVYLHVFSFFRLISDSTRLLTHSFAVPLPIFSRPLRPSWRASHLTFLYASFQRPSLVFFAEALWGFFGELVIPGVSPAPLSLFTPVCSLSLLFVFFLACSPLPLSVCPMVFLSSVMTSLVLADDILWCSCAVP